MLIGDPLTRPIRSNSIIGHNNLPWDQIPAPLENNPFPKNPTVAVPDVNQITKKKKKKRKKKMQIYYFKSYLFYQRGR
jgi:hypothetical protein